MMLIFTPHVSDVMGVIVLTSSVCLCMGASHYPGGTERNTDLNFGMEVKLKDI